MGGIARHMNHIYDDMGMKFSTILEIFSLASSGKLQATEKVDGQNLYFTYDKASRLTKFARKEEEAASGGLTKDQLGSEFLKKRDASDDPSGYQGVVDAFYLGMEAIEKALSNISDETKNTVFDRAKEVEGRQISTVYMNCEVMYSGNRNLILYDGDFIVFHNYDILDEKLNALPEEALAEIDTAMREKFMVIVSEIEKQEAQAAANQWKVVGPQVVALNNMGEEGSKEFVNDAKTDLMSIISQRGLSLDDTFGDYIAASVREEIIPKLIFDQKLSDALIDAAVESAKNPASWSASPTVGGDKIPEDPRERMRFLKAMHGGSKADRKVISRLFSKSYGVSLQKIILEPFAQFAVAYTSKILDGVESSFMIDNKQGQQVFIETVNMAIEYFRQKFKEEEDPSSELSKLRKIARDDSKVSALDRKSRADLKKAIESSDKFKLKYETQMGRLVSVDRITTPVEGVVFEYPPGSNKYYKFTGGFAASNQLLGMLGWADKERFSKEAKKKVMTQTKALSEAYLDLIIKKAMTLEG